MTISFTPELLVAIQAGLDRGDPLALIAFKAGTTRGRVTRLLDAGHVVRTSARSRGCGASHAPSWVPHDLRPDYIDNRKLYGAAKADVLVRRAMAEAAQPEV